MSQLRILIFVTLIAAAVGTAYWMLRPTSPELPVQVWVKGRGTGETVRLYASGRFESSHWCDVCTPTSQTGTWTESPGAITLRRTSGEIAVLRHIRFRGCRALARKEAPEPRLPTDVFFQASERCGDAR